MLTTRTILLLFFFTSSVMCAQSTISMLDSTYRYSKEHPYNEEALYRLNASISEVYDLAPDTAFFYSTQEAQLASTLGNKELLAQSYLQMGKCLEFKALLDSSIIFYKIAEQVSTQHELYKQLLDVYDRLGRVYSKKGYMETSVEYTLKAIDIMDLQNDTAYQGIVYQNVALRLSELGDYDQSINFYKRAISKNKLHKKNERLSANYLNLGHTLFLINRFDSSYYYYNKGLEIARISSNRVKQVACYAGMAISKLQLHSLSEAQAYNDSTLKLANEINDPYGYYKSRQIQGLIDVENGEYQKAAEKLEEALHWFENANYLSTTLNILSSLSDIYANLENNNKAFKYLKLYTTTRDSTYLKQKDLAVRQVNHYREQQQEKERELLNKEVTLQAENATHRKNQRNAFIAIGMLLFLLLVALANRYLFERKTKQTLHKRNQEIEYEKTRSDGLLLNILPEDIADELKKYGKSKARHIEDVTVLFTDFSGFTRASQNMSAAQLVDQLNTCFSAFDQLIDSYGIEKIKTIGDAYMAASGLHSPRKSTAADMVKVALEMQEFIRTHAKILQSKSHQYFEMRAGIHTGPVVAGIVGVKKFQYDIWGDTVNTASRMESNGEVGKVNISNDTYELIKTDPAFAFESRGKIEVKGKGKMEMWFVSFKE